MSWLNTRTSPSRYFPIVAAKAERLLPIPIFRDPSVRVRRRKYSMIVEIGKFETRFLRKQKQNVTSKINVR